MSRRFLGHVPRILQSSRGLATSSAAASTQVSSPSAYRLVAGVVLARSPQIQRSPTAFEQAYFNYQKQLARHTSAFFPTDFYFKKGSIAEKRWQRQQEIEKREDIFNPSASSQKEAKTVEKAEVEEDDKSIGGDLEAKVEPASRVTEADKKGDVKSLDRALDRTLYLIVKKPREEHAWQFPQGGLDDNELLHQAAERELTEECGPNLDTWFVGRAPVGHYVYDYPAHFSKGSPYKGSKVFFMKAHVFAGKVQVDQREIVDYAWVTKEELKNYVDPRYYEAVRDMLSDI
ncbi:mitochondrial 54S ribosomal protein mL46 [Calcarisporiella thermophila]|uniref:mitochondrial 54S ribosomal protein mL46 n=1 Tax=Calcarisporiella thermophila TaxID=911321 RepID=UPI003743ADAC